MKLSCLAGSDGRLNCTFFCTNKLYYILWEGLKILIEFSMKGSDPPIQTPSVEKIQRHVDLFFLADLEHKFILKFIPHYRGVQFILRDSVQKKPGYFMTLCKIHLTPTYPT